MRTYEYVMSNEAHRAMEAACHAYKNWQAEGQQNAAELVEAFDQAEKSLPDGLTTVLSRIYDRDDVVRISNVDLNEPYALLSSEKPKVEMPFSLAFMLRHATSPEFTGLNFKYASYAPQILRDNMAQGLHHDGRADGRDGINREHYITIALACMKVGPEPIATQMLSLGTALRNPVVAEILQCCFGNERLQNANTTLKDLFENEPVAYTAFGHGFMDRVEYMAEEIRNAATKDEFVLLKPNERVIFSNQQFLHARSSAAITNKFFPDHETGGDRRELERCQMPFFGPETPLQRVYREASEITQFR